MRIVFLDTETTGLYPHLGHQVWEIGMIVTDTTNLNEENEILFRVAPDLSRADPAAIQVNKFYEVAKHVANGQDGDRWPDGSKWSDPISVAYTTASTLAGALIVGNNPAFDELMLAEFCRKNHQVLANFHRKINVVDLALGHLHHELVAAGVAGEDVSVMQEAVRLPHSSRKVMDAAGCPPNENPHTALGDARHVRDAFMYLTSGIV